MPTRRRISPARYRRITLVSLWLLAFIIVTGASVRLTGSGLGCSDWPTCEQDQLVAEVDDLHAMIEFVNRMITGLVSLAVVAAVLGSMAREPRRRDLTLWSWGLVVGVLAQIVVGALVVREHLPPSLVITHFLLSMVLVWNALVLHHRAGMADSAGAGRELPGIQARARLTTVLATAVLFSGTLVTGAGPHSGSETEQTRKALEAKGADVGSLGPSDLEVERLPFDVPDVARAHGITVALFLAATLWLLWAVRRDRRAADLLEPARMLVLVILVQAAVGYIQYFTDVPALLVGIHVAGATAVWVATMRLHLRVRNPVEDPQRAVASSPVHNTPVATSR